MSHVSEKAVLVPSVAKVDGVHIQWGNVPMKPAQRKQLLSGLRRCVSLGKTLRGFGLSIVLHHIGKAFTIRAVVNDSRGQSEVHVKETHWHSGMRQLLRNLHTMIHTRRIEMLRLAT
jgi:hypothetical protein